MEYRQRSVSECFRFYRESPGFRQCHLENAGNLAREVQPEEAPGSGKNVSTNSSAPASKPNPIHTHLLDFLLQLNLVNEICQITTSSASEMFQRTLNL